MTQKSMKKKTKTKNHRQPSCDDHHDHSDHHHDLIDPAAELDAEDDDHCCCCHCGAGQEVNGINFHIYSSNIGCVYRMSKVVVTNECGNTFS